MRIRLARGVLRVDSGTTLVGGAPLSVLRLRRPVRDDEDTATRLGQRLVATGIGVPDPSDAAPVVPADLTVVVPVHDRAVALERLAPLTVVVVDDASSVPVAGALRREVNGGPAAARNTGLATVTTPFVAFVDSDVEVGAEDLLSLSRHLADPVVVAVGPRVRGRAPGRAWWQRHDETHSALDLGPHPAEVRPGGTVGYLPSACLVARTSALGDGFDEAMRVGEDVDLVWRLHAAGGRIRYDPSVVVRHATRPTLGSVVRQVFGYGTSAAPLSARHGAAVAPAVLSPVHGLAAAAVLTRHRAAPLAVLAAVAWSTRQLSRTLDVRTSARMSGRASWWAVRQESSLLVRHWWPAALAVSLVSSTARRAVVTALAVDTAVALADHRESGPVALVAGRRLGDLAYGAGVWVGAWRARSARCLLPRRT